MLELFQICVIITNIIVLPAIKKLTDLILFSLHVFPESFRSEHIFKIQKQHPNMVSEVCANIEKKYKLFFVDFFFVKIF